MGGGKHNLRMGADFVRNQAVDGFALNRGNPRGSMTYSEPTTCAAAALIPLLLVSTPMRIHSRSFCWGCPRPAPAMCCRRGLP